MNYYLRKNGSVAGPMSQADFLARLSSGEYSATDEMSTDGRVWTRLGLTGFARAARQSRGAASAAARAIGPVVGDLTGGAPAQPPAAAREAHKRPSSVVDVPPVAVHARGPRPPRPPRFWQMHPWLAVLLAAALAALAWFLVRLFAPFGPPPRGPVPEPPPFPEDGGRPASGPVAAETRFSESGAAAALPSTVAGYLEPSEASVREAFERVRSSAAVQGNSRYAEIARGTGCQLSGDDVVNAYAGWRKLDSGEQVRAIWYTAGHFRFDRVVAAMAAKAVFSSAADPGEKSSALSGLLRGLPEALRADGGRLGARRAADLLAKAGIDDGFFSGGDAPTAAVAISEGIAVSTFSHEMGHQVLGHLDEKGTSSAGLVGNRAKEEQADAFAVEVMDSKTGSERETMFLGRFLWAFQMAVAENADTDAGSTHPLARRRLRSLVESDPDLSKKFGFDFDKIEKLLDGLKTGGAVASAAVGAGSGGSQLRAEVSGFGAAPAGAAARTVRVNPAFLEWAEGNGGAAPASEIAGTGRFSGFVPEFADMSYLAGMGPEAAGETAAARPAKALARKFDLRRENAVTAVRDQGSYGTCWAHAALGSMESALLRSTGKAFDLSENNLVNGNGLVSGWNGGNAGAASAYFLRWGGPVLENDDAYPAPGAKKRAAPAFHVQRVRWIPGKRGDLDHDAIKDALVSYGALWVALQWESGCESGEGGVNYRYSGAPKGNHAVTLVGWDDDYPRSRFKDVPPGDGAYLVKNSWGTKAGDRGYYWVSYYDTSFARAAAVGALYAYDGAESAANYGKLYQHDPYGFVTCFDLAFESDGKCPSRGANMFVATGDDEIAAVGFYALGPSTSYSVSVYTGCEEGDPVSGKAAVSGQKGVLDTAGYFTVPLARPVRVSKGERFSVVLGLSTPDLDTPLAMELVVSVNGKVYPSENITAAEGQSFVSPDGRNWLDVCAALPQNRINFCCKAYANPGPASAAAESAPAVPSAAPALRLARPSSGSSGLNPAFVEWAEKQEADPDGAESPSAVRATGLAPETFDMSRLPR